MLFWLGIIPLFMFEFLAPNMFVWFQFLFGSQFSCCIIFKRVNMFIILVVFYFFRGIICFLLRGASLVFVEALL